VVTTAKLCLVDLAGSERQYGAVENGQTLVEAAAINKSLSALSNVFTAIRTHQSHVPYRNSKLTHALQVGQKKHPSFFSIVVFYSLDLSCTFVPFLLAASTASLSLNTHTRALSHAHTHTHTHTRARARTHAHTHTHTHLLQDSLGGDSKTCVFIHVRPDRDHLAESISTLNFGSNIRKIVLEPTRHVGGPPRPPSARPPTPPKKA
jgi:hypothetical protein